MHSSAKTCSSASKPFSPKERYCRSEQAEWVAGIDNRTEGAFMTKKVADQVAETLAAVGVERIYGVVGDSLNGITDSLRRQAKIGWVHMRNEEVGALAAGAEAHLTGKLAVCAGSCGPGNVHLMCPFFLSTTMRGLNPDWPRLPRAMQIDCRKPARFLHCDLKGPLVSNCRRL